MKKIIFLLLFPVLCSGQNITDINEWATDTTDVFLMVSDTVPKYYVFLAECYDDRTGFLKPDSMPYPIDYKPYVIIAQRIRTYYTRPYMVIYGDKNYKYYEDRVRYLYQGKPLTNRIVWLYQKVKP